MTRRLQRRVQISKDDGEAEKNKVFRLTDIEPEFVSLVRAGANRQKNFQVVKEDEQDGVDGKYVCESCGHEETHEAGVKCDELKCSKCSGAMTPKKDNDGDPPGQAAAGKKTGDDGGDGNGTDGDGTEGSETDLSSWLDEAGTKVELLSLDLGIQRALDSQSDGDADPTMSTAPKAHKIDSGAPPVVAKEETEDGNGEKDKRILKLEGDLRKTRNDLTRSKAAAARLVKGVGKSSVMLTGEVTAKDLQQDDAADTSPTDGAFHSGADIAAVVTSKGG